MKSTTVLSTLLGFGLVTATACESQEQNVDEEMQDLKEARQNTQQVSTDLQRQLEEAKAEVVRLEEKLALARQGVTDEVIEERQDLKQALKEQEQEVEAEVVQARQEAAEHNQDSQKARGALEETTPARVDAEVNTQTQVQPGQTQEIEGREVEETIRIEQNRVETEEEVERQDAQTEQRTVPAPQS